MVFKYNDSLNTANTRNVVHWSLLFFVNSLVVYMFSPIFTYLIYWVIAMRGVYLSMNFMMIALCVCVSVYKHNTHVHVCTALYFVLDLYKCLRASFKYVHHRTNCHMH